MKKLIASLISLALLACLALPAASAERKISVVTTIFPIYDWVREVVGDGLDGIDLIQLLDNGVDLHSYQPTAQDILKVSTADLFIYVGGESDEWVEDVLNSAMNPDIRVISLVEAMGEDIRIEEEVEGMEPEHPDGDEENEEKEEADEHVWLSLRGAQKLVRVIADALAEIDAAHGEAYQANAAAYCDRLAALDAQYVQTVENADVKTLLFGDRFPFRYLVEDYGLRYYAAFSGCSAESEASFETVVFLARKVGELDLPAVLTIEDTTHRIAETVAAASDRPNVRILTLDSMQRTTSREAEEGATYLGVMEANLEVLRQALTR